MIKQDYAPIETTHRISAWGIAGYGCMAVAATALPIYILAHIIVWWMK